MEAKHRETIDPGANLAWAAARFGGREAVADGGRRLSFLDLNRRSRQIANALIHHGLAPEGRVAKLMSNCAEIIETGFATAMAGGASLNLHPRGSVAEHLHMLEDSGAEFLFVDEAHREQARALREGATRLRRVIGVGWREEGVESYDGWLERASARPPGVEVGPEGLFHLHYTSGTSGQPKAVVNTHRTHRAWMRNFFLNLDYRLGAGDSMLHAAPLTHAAFNYTETYLLRGARNIILPRFDPELYIAAVARERVTTAFLVPTMLLALLECESLKRADLTSLHTLNYGTSPISEETLCRAVEAIGPILRQTYGLTEARQPIALLHSWEHVVSGTPEQRRRLASCGKPAAGVTFALLDEEDRPVAAGEMGEICLRGDYAMAGYWKDPEATAEAMRSGWVHSGDLAVTDEDGYVYIVDRKKDMIISGGFNIYPSEVERALCRHPDVLEAAVVGVPDAHWGEAVKALIVPRHGRDVSASEIAEFCRKEIASYKKPKHVEIVKELPKNSRGKILRREIRDRHWAGRTRKVN